MTDRAEPSHRAYLERSLGAHASYKLHYHLVWSVKARRRVLLGPVAEALRAILCEIADTAKISILALHVEPEHVHVLARLRPDTAVAIAVGRLKGASAHHLRQSFSALKALDEGSFWSDGYFARTVGDITTAQAKSYLDRQREHHSAANWDTDTPVP